MVGEILRQDRENLTVLCAPVKLDTLASVTLEQICANLVSEGRYRVVMECGQLEFLNSLVLEILVGFHQQALQNGGGLKFANLPVCIEDVFRLTKLDQVLSCYSSVEEAIAAF